MQEGKVFQIRKASDICSDRFQTPEGTLVLTVAESDPEILREPTVNHYVFDGDTLEELFFEVQDWYHGPGLLGTIDRQKVQIADLTRELERERNTKTIRAGEAIKAGQMAYVYPGGMPSVKVTPETIGKLEAERDDQKRANENLLNAIAGRDDEIRRLDAKMEAQSREHSRIVGQRDREISNLRHLREKAWKPIEMIAEYAGIPIGSDEEFSHFADAVRDRIGKGDMVEEIRKARDEHYAELVRTRKQFRDFLGGCLLNLKATESERAVHAEIEVLSGIVLKGIATSVGDRDRLRGMLTESEKARHADSQRHDLDRTSWRLADAKLREILGIEPGVQLVEAVKDIIKDRRELYVALERIARLMEIPGTPAAKLPDLVEESLHAARLVKYPAFKGLDDFEDDEDLDEDDDHIDWGDDEVTLSDALDECGANFPPGASLTEKVRAVVDEINDRNTLFASLTGKLQRKGVTWGPGAIDKVIDEWDELRRFRDGVGQMVGAANVKDIPQIFAALSRIIIGKEAEEYRIRTEGKPAAFQGSYKPAIAPGYSWRFRRVDLPTVNAPHYDRVIAKDYEEAWDIMDKREGGWIHDPETTEEQARRSLCLTRWGRTGN